MAYKVGDIVEIINTRPSGGTFIEGRAKLIRQIDCQHFGHTRWLVRFEGDAEDETYERFVRNQTK